MICAIRNLFAVHIPVVVEKKGLARAMTLTGIREVNTQQIRLAQLQRYIAVRFLSVSLNQSLGRGWTILDATSNVCIS
jgi:hypothetical protein